MPTTLSSAPSRNAEIHFNNIKVIPGVPPELAGLGWVLINKDLPERVNTVDPEITAACDHHCDHCWADLTGKHMTMETFTKVLRFAKESGVRTLQFTGGEPTLNPRFEAMAKAAKDEGFNLILRTHGRNLDPDYLKNARNPALREKRPFAEVIAEYFDEVIISLDGTARENFAMRPSVNPRHYEANEADSTVLQQIAERQYQQTLGGIRALSEACLERQRQGETAPSLLINTVAARKNLLGIGALGEALQRLVTDERIPIKRWDITQVMESHIASSKGANPDDYLISNGEFHYALKAAAYHTSDIPIRGKGITPARCYIVSADGKVYVGGSDRVDLGDLKSESPDFQAISTAMRTYHTENDLAGGRASSYLQCRMPH